jgi:hypothetical protein
VELYDDFSTPGPGGEPDPRKWTIGQMVVDGQVVWTWRDKDLQVQSGPAGCELQIPVFTAQHDTVGIFDNPKVLYCSTGHLRVGDRPLRMQARMACEFNGDLSSYADGFAGFHALDFGTGTVMDVVGNGNRLWAIIERLPIPGLDSPVEPFIEFHDLGLQSAPLQEHLVGIEYDPQRKLGRWLVDGEVRYEREVLMNPQAFFFAFGLLTLHPQVDGRSVSNKGQGGRGRWRDFSYENAAEVFYPYGGG